MRQNNYTHCKILNGIEKDWKDLKKFFLGCYKAKVSARWC